MAVPPESFAACHLSFIQSVPGGSCTTTLAGLKLPFVSEVTVTLGSRVNDFEAILPDFPLPFSAAWVALLPSPLRPLPLRGKGPGLGTTRATTDRGGRGLGTSRAASFRGNVGAAAFGLCPSARTVELCGFLRGFPSKGRPSFAAGAEVPLCSKLPFRAKLATSPDRAAGRPTATFVGKTASTDDAFSSGPLPKGPYSRPRRMKNEIQMATRVLTRNLAW
mmetsp:Transcript_839/g.1906  ORF Transcript_839/g.1906 Transcript_839/m.1906 type:complete len:220 (+) Transcript_839:617-1276(+)